MLNNNLEILDISCISLGVSTFSNFQSLIFPMDAGWPLYVHGIVRLVKNQNVLKCVTMQTKTQNKPKSHKLRLRCCSEHTKIKMITTESLTYLSSNQSRNKLIRTCKSGSIPKSGFHRFSSRNREFVNSMLNLFL